MNLNDELCTESIRLLDVFEQEWLQASTPPDITQYCQQRSGESSFVERRLAWELAMTDLEFRWRSTKASMRRNTLWYAEHLARFGLTSKDVDELRDHEWIVRSRWADKPTVAEFCKEQFPDVPASELASVHHHFRAILEAEFPLHCRWSFAGQPASEVQLPTPCTAGRQRSKEPPPLALIHHQDKQSWRLVVAPRELNTVSRDQLQLTRQAIDVIEIIPLSELVDCFIESIRIQKGVRSEFQLGARGIEVRFGNCILWLRRV
jgi:hypothetical protein